ncbi:hypothetical protein HAX54_021013 [Datura stramonium]|uniref:Uncharacterized protein n=1 Tax=Datura stramonium TaxID=4076 RepID=A0ABS8S3U2_DATST|nr:hypothetical protein [Datura stramonium]
MLRSRRRRREWRREKGGFRLDSGEGKRKLKRGEGEGERFGSGEAVKKRREREVRPWDLEEVPAFAGGAEVEDEGEEAVGVGRTREIERRAGVCARWRRRGREGRGEGCGGFG